MAREYRLVDVDVIADHLGVGRKVVLKLARRGLIPVIRISRKCIACKINTQGPHLGI